MFVDLTLGLLLDYSNTLMSKKLFGDKICSTISVLTSLALIYDPEAVLHGRLPQALSSAPWGYKGSREAAGEGVRECLGEGGGEGGQEGVCVGRSDGGRARAAPPFLYW